MLLSSRPTAVRVGNAVVPFALAGAVLLALAVRYQFFLLNGGGAADYQEWALAHYFGGITRNYLQGIDHLLNLEPWGKPAYPPGYSLVLAAFSLLGADSPQTFRLCQAGLDSLTVLPLFYACRRISGSRGAGLVVAGAYAVSPLFAFNAVMLLAEALSPLFVSTTLALLLWARDGGSLRWGGLGLVAAFAALVRPDLVLFCIPLGAWWLFTSRKAIHLVALVIAFSIPLLSWGAYSKASTGHFTVTSNSGAYAMWAGLGQIPSEHDYFVNDVQAKALLQENGIQWHSAEANDFWRSEYLRAWREHPGHVIDSILWRLGRMPFDQMEYSAPPAYAGVMETYFTTYGLLVLAIAVAALLVRRSYAAAFVISLPLLYALASLGPVYYEARYVRYISLSYLLAPVILVGLYTHGLLRGALLAATAVAIALDAGSGAAALAREAKTARLSAAISQAIEAGQGETIATLADFSWIKAVPNVDFSATPEGLSVVTSAEGSAYQVVATPNLPSGPLHIRYEAELFEGQVVIGVLAPDGSRWLVNRYIAQEGLNAGEMSVYLPQGGTILVTNARPENRRSRFTLSRLEIIRTTEP